MAFVRQANIGGWCKYSKSKSSPEQEGIWFSVGSNT